MITRNYSGDTISFSDKLVFGILKDAAVECAGITDIESVSLTGPDDDKYNVAVHAKMQYGSDLQKCAEVLREVISFEMERTFQTEAGRIDVFVDDISPAL